MSKKRKSVEGTLRLRKDGRWEARIVVGYNDKGLPITKSATAKEKEKCLEKLELLKGQYRVTAAGNVKDDMQFGDWMDFWYQQYEKQRIRPTTQAHYENIIYKHVIPEIGIIPLNKLTQNDLQQFYARLKVGGRIIHTDVYGKGLSDRMVRGCHSVCRKGLEKAVKEGLIRVNPAIGCKLPPKKAKEMQVLTKEEMQRFIIQAKADGYFELFILELCTGMRRDEIAVLQWNDLNNEAYRLGYTRVGCWCCPNNSGWSQFLASIYMPEQHKRFRDILLDFAVKMGKEDPEEYITSGGWKARQGGAGIELSKNVAISFKPCATDAKSFNYVLNKPISDDLYEFFKPFGLLDFTMGKERLGEVYILDFKTKQPIIKLQGRRGTNELKITILSTPIAGKTKINEIELKFKCQITKFQLCAGCHACENACKHNAIKLIKNGEGDTEYKYLIDDNKCVHCFECINHYTGGCYMRRVLLPRGKGYSDDK